METTTKAKDVVFSQTSLNTQSVLKVVELDRLKKNHQVNGSVREVNCTGGYSSTAPSSPVATTSNTEVSRIQKTVLLKTEPLYDHTMFHESDFEFFQELDPLFCSPAKEEVVQTIDSSKKTEEKALNIDTPHIPFSPQGWDQFDVKSPLPQAGFYNITPIDPLSPSEKFGQLDNNNMFNFAEGDNLQSQEKFLDSLPLVSGDLTSGPVTSMTSWQTAAEPVEWPTTSDTHYDLIYTNTPNTAPFIHADDSLDLKFGSVTPVEVEIINLTGSEFIMNKEHDFVPMQNLAPPKKSEGLSVDVSARTPAWAGEISTPIILNDVISLEKEKCTEILDPPNNPQFTSTETFTTLKTSPKMDYEPITPKSESHLESDYDDSKSSSTSKRRRHDSEDSDETYTPYSEQPPRKYKRRKPSVPIKDLILALESQPKARRGRPPKRRESTVSSVCSVDENSSTSTQEFKYRELRDKNNEASKRSRMNRKLKEQQMELLAVELEEKNKRLRVEADILEEMTKKLKSELMSAILSR